MEIKPHDFVSKQPWKTIEWVVGSIFFAAFYIGLLYWGIKFLLLFATALVDLLTWMGFTL